MKKTALSLVATLVLALLLAMSTAVAVAGWDWDDCPPASQSAKAHASDQAKANWLNVHPPAAEQAWK